MAENVNADGRADKLIGLTGSVMALCCLAGPAILSAAAGAAIGYGLGVAAALAIAWVAVVALWRWRAGASRRC